MKDLCKESGSYMSQIFSRRDGVMYDDYDDEEIFRRLAWCVILILTLGVYRLFNW